ncbi:MAG: sugar phosphate isomerase/epimerase family protein [Planctomycetota bacterium]
MLSLSMNEVTTFRWSFVEDVHRFADAGYDGIGVWRQKISDFGEDRGVELLEESSLRVTNLLWAGGFTGSDGRSLRDAIDDAAEAIRLAAELNAGCLVVYPGGRNNHTYRHAERLLRNALDELLDLAVPNGVVLAIEPMHPACATEWTFLNDIASAVAFVEQFQCPELKIVFDTYHFGQDQSVLANLTEIVQHIGMVHLGDLRDAHSIDQDRCPLGEGRIPLGRIVRGLIDAGYEGDFDVELIGHEIELSDYDSLLASSRNVFSELLTPVSGG